MSLRDHFQRIEVVIESPPLPHSFDFGKSPIDMARAEYTLHLKDSVKKAVITYIQPFLTTGIPNEDVINLLITIDPNNLPYYVSATREDVKGRAAFINQLVVDDPSFTFDNLIGEYIRITVVGGTHDGFITWMCKDIFEL